MASGSAAIDAVATSLVSTDIDGDIRSTPADQGADEFESSNPAPTGLANKPSGTGINAGAAPPYLWDIRSETSGTLTDEGSNANDADITHDGDEETDGTHGDFIGFKSANSDQGLGTFTDALGSTVTMWGVVRTPVNAAGTILGLADSSVTNVFNPCRCGQAPT